MKTENNQNIFKMSDALTLEEIQASTDLSGKIASASAFSKFITFNEGVSGVKYTVIGNILIVRLLDVVISGEYFDLGIGLGHHNVVATLRDEDNGYLAIMWVNNSHIASYMSSNYTSGHKYSGCYIACMP